VKWQQIAIESIKQCGSPWLTKIDAPARLKDQLARRETFELPLIASLQDDSRHPREFIQHFQDEHKRRPTSACVWIGPEGDFSPAEMNSIKSEGALPVTLGRLVLRSDTAAIYSLSVLNYELQR
jgi:16S rRNA (uracil1498-N3)-methyltransferase